MSDLVSKLKELYNLRVETSYSILELEDKITSVSKQYIGTTLQVKNEINTTKTISVTNFVFYHTQRFYFITDYTFNDSSLKSKSRWNRESDDNIPLLVEVYDLTPYSINNTKSIFTSDELSNQFLISKDTHFDNNLEESLNQSEKDVLSFVKSDEILNTLESESFKEELNSNFKYLSNTLTNKLSGFKHPDFDYIEINGGGVPTSKMGLLMLFAKLKDFSNFHEKNYLVFKLNKELPTNASIVSNNLKI